MNGLDIIKISAFDLLPYQARTLHIDDLIIKDDDDRLSIQNDS